MHTACCKTSYSSGQLWPAHYSLSNQAYGHIQYYTLMSNIPVAWNAMKVVPSPSLFSSCCASSTLRMLCLDLLASSTNLTAWSANSCIPSFLQTQQDHMRRGCACCGANRASFPANRASQHATGVPHENGQATAKSLERHFAGSRSTCVQIVVYIQYM